jgi:hypothetical protein
VEKEHHHNTILFNPEVHWISIYPQKTHRYLPTENRYAYVYQRITWGGNETPEGDA